MAYELIETIEVGAGGAASIEFTSIPQDGVDLLLLVSARADSSTTFQSNITINSDTTSANYPRVRLQGTGSSVSSGSFANAGFGNMEPSTFTANTFANDSVYFSNYTSSSAKSISGDGVTENNASSSYQNIQAVSYSGTSAITSLTITANSGDIVQYSTASLYKIY